MASGLGVKCSKKLSVVAPLERTLPAWFAKLDLFPVPPYSLGLAAYELLPDGHKRCFHCKEVLSTTEFSGCRSSCKACSNASARRIYKLRQLQKQARRSVFARRYPELVSAGNNYSPAAPADGK
jgi:hypothetical protein